MSSWQNSMLQMGLMLHCKSASLSLQMLPRKIELMMKPSMPKHWPIERRTKRGPPSSKKRPEGKAYRQQQLRKSRLKANSQHPARAKMRHRPQQQRAFDEAERCRVEEEQRQIDEEERKEEEERERKRERKAARIAKQKAEGTYLTKKQRDQAKRAAQVREQLGYRMAEEESLEVLEAETAAESDDHKDSSHSRDSDSSSSSTPLRAPVITVMGYLGFVGFCVVLEPL